MAGKPRPERHSIKFKLWRLASGLTQQQAAEDLGVALSTIGNWDRGRPPSVDFLPDIAELFGCTIDNLFRDPPSARRRP